MKLTNHAREALEKILKSFETGEVPEAIAISLLPRLDVPSNAWSLNNRLLMFFSGTSDARGIRQWREVGRWPRKGSHAVYILVPMFARKQEEDKAETEEQILVGFRCCPVFRAEDTEGAVIEHPDLAPAQPPPLSEVAHAWGIEVTYMPGGGMFDGYYSPAASRIGLATHDNSVFFHELGHAAYHQIKGNWGKGPDWRDEVVAELTAATLAHLYGERPNDGAAYRYIEACAEAAGKEVYRACLMVIADVGRCLELILAQAGVEQMAAD